VSDQTVTVGVPVYQGQDFLGEALAALQAQTYTDIRVLISLDGPDAGGSEIITPFLRDPRFVLTTRRRRKGWAGNINWLMRHTDTAYWCYQQQDDLIDVDYLECLVDHLRAAPQAAVAYCDIQAFGQADWSMAQQSLVGHPVTRQLRLLHEHLPAVPFRGVTRTEALREMDRLPFNPVSNFAVDTVWMAAMARTGELHRVPGYRYRKRYHDANIHTKWPTWPAQQRQRAWATHCADMLHEGLKLSGLTVQERRLLWAAAVMRLTDPRLAGDYVAPDETGPAQWAGVLATFTARIRAHRPAVATELDMSAPELVAWTEDFHRAEGATRPHRLRRELATALPPRARSAARVAKRRLAAARARGHGSRR
jgi:hypothetical protein